MEYPKIYGFKTPKRDEKIGPLTFSHYECEVHGTINENTIMWYKEKRNDVISMASRVASPHCHCGKRIAIRFKEEYGKKES